MTFFQAIISGIVQGITEFFPISSSGHLVLLHHLLGIKGDMLTFDVFLHFGTLLAVAVFFWKDILNMAQKDRRLLKLIIIASIPTFAIAFTLKHYVESFFSTTRAVGIFLMITGFFLLLASMAAIYWKTVRKEKPLGTVNSIIIGIAQGIAVLPGISRSGATIGTALIAGLNEEMALKFSFLLSLPAVLGANILKADKIYGNLVSMDASCYIAGFIASAITGFFAIKVLFVLMRKNLFFVFGIYCIFMGFSVVILSAK